MVLAQTNYNSGGSNYQQNKYLYNSKELQNDGFGGVSLDWYDYGARMYDPALGRWHVQDNFSEKYFSLSPYNYCANNPLLYTDPTGDTIQYTFEDVYALVAMASKLTQFSSEQLGGQFNFTLTNNGDGFTLGMEATKGGGDVSALSKEGKAFHGAMKSMINSETVLKQEISLGNSSVDLIDPVNNKLDIYDVNAFDRQSGGPTGASVFMHETYEQFVKAQNGMGPGEPNFFQRADHLMNKNGYWKPEVELGHNRAMQLEEKVGGYSRDGRKFYQNGKVVIIGFERDKTGNIKVVKKYQ